MTVDEKSESVLTQRNGAVAVITINRPTQRNALDTAAKVALREALEAAATDVSVRAVLLTGAGGHFCAGQDLAEHAATLSSGPAHAFDTVSEHYSPIVMSLATMPKPVIAAVEGVCVGAGLGFALACDMRVVSAAAKLSTAFSSIALTCDSGLAYTLPRAVGHARARELIMVAKPVSGEQGQELGMVTELVEAGRALETALALATQLAAGPTRAYAESKQLLNASCTSTLEMTLLAEKEAQIRAGNTTDHLAAVEAFIAKRLPSFVGA